MTLSQFWLVWIADFAVFVAIWLVRLLSLDPQQRPRWLAVGLFSLAFGVFGAGAGVVQLATDPAAELATPAHIVAVVLALWFALVLTALLVREVRTAAVRLTVRAGAAALLENRYADALAAYERVPRARPRAAMGWIGKAVALLWQDRYDETVAACDRALALQPKLARTWALKAAALAFARRDAEALAACDQALALAPRDAEAWAYRGFALRQQGRPDEALAACARALDPDATRPSDGARANAWSNQALALGALGRHEEALAAAERAIALASLPVFARLAQAEALAHLQRPEEARAAAEGGLATAEQTLALRPGYAGAWEAKGALLRLLGRESEATAAEQQARALQA